MVVAMAIVIVGCSQEAAVTPNKDSCDLSKIVGVEYSLSGVSLVCETIADDPYKATLDTVELQMVVNVNGHFDSLALNGNKLNTSQTSERDEEMVMYMKRIKSMRALEMVCDSSVLDVTADTLLTALSEARMSNESIYDTVKCKINLVRYQLKDMLSHGIELVLNADDLARFLRVSYEKAQFSVRVVVVGPKGQTSFEYKRVKTKTKGVLYAPTARMRIRMR